MVADLLRVAGALALLALLVCLLLALFGKGPVGREVARRSRERRDDLARMAAGHGWWSGQDDDVADRAWDDTLSGSRAPLCCELLIDGGDDGFVAETWLLPGRHHQHLLRLPCPGAGNFLVRGLPRKDELRLFPARFRNDAGFVQFHTPMLVGGDFAGVQDRLGPFIEAIEASRAWVVGTGDELVVMTGSDPSPADFELRLALGRALVRALAGEDRVDSSPPGD
ncbi:hypothetical protein [Nocardioides sp. AE5]|uniref:hypothetical protein n=1 Tax=Nocardioides sp. AE5 TaxID=2962573 RepID=UPI0028821BB2|nr:hypothetical protein [Nocardioides sp. AE5]MDT0201127.1 hypothetical protein [Nocardioides sp. AE5]